MSCGMVLGVMRVGETKLRKYLCCNFKVLKNNVSKRKGSAISIDSSNSNPNDSVSLSDRISIDEFKNVN